jgi:hypothetical protein
VYRHLGWTPAGDAGDGDVRLQKLRPDAIAGAVQGTLPDGCDPLLWQLLRAPRGRAGAYGSSSGALPPWCLLLQRNRRARGHGHGGDAVLG